MSEDAPHYGERVFVCEGCKQPFTPTPPEAEALAAMEREFGLRAGSCSALCAACQAHA